MLAQNVHFIGIAGAGMSAVAKLLRDSGVSVTGSDEGVYPPISDFLAAEGLPCAVGYSPENIPPQAEIIVIGKNAKLVSATNAEVRAAYDSGKTILSFPEVLNLLAQGRETAVVAGSYGKSTCAALLAHVLEQGGADPSFFIGAIPLTPPTSSRLGAGKLFVLEGDEYPSSNTDPRAKFLHYRPKYLLLAPLAHDHVNVYPTIEDYLKPFAELAEIPEQVIACTEGPLSARFLSSLRRPIITYGFQQGDYCAANVAWGGTTHFDLMYRGERAARLETSQLGEHSVQNAVGVAAFVLSQKLLGSEQLARGIASFKGVRRRLDLKSEKTAIPIFEGFGSSYEKARSAIAAVKLHFPLRRLVVAFEPHAFSWRNREALPWYDHAFEGAETVFVYEPATQGAATHAQVTQAEIVSRIAESGIRAIALPHVDPAAAVAESLRADDVVLLLTSGNLGGVIERLPGLAEAKFPA